MKSRNSRIMKIAPSIKLAIYVEFSTLLVLIPGHEYFFKQNTLNWIIFFIFEVLNITISVTVYVCLKADERRRNEVVYMRNSVELQEIVVRPALVPLETIIIEENGTIHYSIDSKCIKENNKKYTVVIHPDTSYQVIQDYIR